MGRNFQLFLNRILGQSNISHELDKIVVALKNNQLEDVVGRYSVFCLNPDIKQQLNKKFGSDVWGNDELINTLIKSKSRYYECLLSMVDGNLKQKLSDKLYSNFSESAAEMRRSLSLKCNDDFFRDRIMEWKKLFNFDNIHYLTKDILYKKLNDFDISNDEELFRGLAYIAPYYFLRKMQLPTLLDFENLIKILPSLRTHRLKVLDYGCGAADLSIYLAQKGHEITLCDIEGGNLMAAIKRFKLRNLMANYIPVHYTQPIPDIKERFDLIIGIEVIEHVRHPLKLLQLFNRILNENGVVMLGSFPFSDTKAEGDHLKEAVDAKDSLLEWIDINWTSHVKCAGNSFKKK